ncbi:MAG: radical SAM protein [Candidatus Odinarchaeia archaeon]
MAPEYVRASIGTASVLGLMNVKMNASPETAYLMLYNKEGCRANCAFCPQARESASNKSLLSRVYWPIFPVEKLVDKFAKKIQHSNLKRICIQCLNYPGFFNDLLEIIEKITAVSDLPISVSIQPVSQKYLTALKEHNVERVGIPLDAATPDIFDKIKGSINNGPYKWETHINCLKEAVKIFGRYNVSTHLIVGLSESEKDAAKFVADMWDLGVNTALFAFTPIQGSKLENMSPPDLGKYRRIQLARFLLINELTTFDKIVFNSSGEIVNFGISKEKMLDVILSGEPFLTSGCKNCNRPYYNESPRGPIYNFPKLPGKKELADILRIFKL